MIFSAHSLKRPAIFPLGHICIIEAVRCNREYAASTQQRIEDIINEWLRYTKELDGGRKDRNKKQRKNEVSLSVVSAAEMVD